MKRPECAVVGCSNNAISKGKNKKTGKVYFKKYCTRHHEERTGKRERKQLLRKAITYGVAIEELENINRKKCSVCGWDKTTCDIHRKIKGINGGRYIQTEKKQSLFISEKTKDNLRNYLKN